MLAKYDGVDEAIFYTSVGLKTASVVLSFLGPLGYVFDVATTISDAVINAEIRAASDKVTSLWQLGSFRGLGFKVEVFGLDHATLLEGGFQVYRRTASSTHY